jgi:hypothetical protein
MWLDLVGLELEGEIETEIVSWLRRMEELG